MRSEWQCTKCSKRTAFQLQGRILSKILNKIYTKTIEFRVLDFEIFNNNYYQNKSISTRGRS